jgi:hypothetical protein
VRVRLTCLGDEDTVIEGEAVDPPQPGRPFVLLIVSQGKVATTRIVRSVGLDSFVTEKGTRYSWACHVGDA